MSRYPADKAPALRGQERYWQVITELAEDGAFTVSAVAGQTNADRRNVSEYMRRLVKAGYLESDAGPGAAAAYTLAKPSRFAPQVRKDGSLVPPTKRECMWRTMRMLKTFTPLDLAVAASTEGAPVQSGDAQDYLKYLAKAGYVRMTRGKTGPASYRLLPGKVTGPLPPQVQRVRQVYDPNIREVVWSAGGGE